MRAIPSLFLCIVASTLLAQDMVRVVPGGPGHTPSEPYLTWETAATNIQTAITYAAGNGYTNVAVSNGVYVLQSSPIIINSAITVRSWNNGEIDMEGAVIDCEGTRRGFLVNNIDALVKGFTIRNARRTGSIGGAIELVAGVVRHCDILDFTQQGVWIGSDGIMEDSFVRGGTDSAQDGFAIRIVGGTVRRCRIFDNTGAQHGIGVSISNGGELLDSFIGNNIHTMGGARGLGGGIYLTEGLVENCEITGNRALRYGGGVYATGPDSRVKNSRITLNISTDATYGFGGGVSLYDGALLRNCLVTENIGRMGGGVHIHDNSRIENSTIVSNEATSRGGGVYRHSTGNVSLNSIVYFNASPDGSNTYQAAGMSWTNNCVAPSVNDWGEGNFTDNPLLDENYRLTRESRCVNTGVYQTWMDDAADLDGHPRIDRLTGQVDIGCYEFVFPGTLIRLQ